LYAAACRAGAHYAGADQAQQEVLWSFGEDLGVAFQIMDDCLDLTGEESVVGKTLGSDLSLGKLTLPMIHLLANSGSERARLERAMSGSASEQGGAELLGAFDVEGSVGYALERGRGIVHRAIGRLTNLPAGPARDAMKDLAEYVLTRDS